MNTFFTITSFALLYRVASQGCSSCCLADAIPPESRTNLADPTAASTYPIGLWTSDRDSANVSVHVMSILIEEMLGFNTLNKSGAGAQDAYRAVAGCSVPEDKSTCPGTEATRYHIALEVRAGFQATDQYQSLTYSDAGTMSYAGRRGHFLRSSAWDETGETSQPNYTHLQSQDTVMVMIFEDYTLVDASQLMACSDSQFGNTTMIRAYLDATNDSPGVTLGSGGGFVADCPNGGKFWLSQACRDAGMSMYCIPYFLKSTDRAIDFLDVMQKADLLDIPWAVAVAADDTAWDSLIQIHNAMFFYQTPDIKTLAYGSMNFVEVIFPEHDSAEWDAGDFRSSAKEMTVRKLMSVDLGSKAPHVASLVQNFDLSSAQMDAIMATTNIWPSLYGGACDWLNQNTAVWNQWLVSTTSTTFTTITSTSTRTTLPTTAEPNTTTTTEATTAESTTTDSTTTAATTQAPNTTQAPVTEDLVIAAVPAASLASVITEISLNPSGFAAVNSVDGGLDKTLIGLPTASVPAGQVVVTSGTTQVALPAQELQGPIYPGIVVAKGTGSNLLPGLPSEGQPGATVTVSGGYYEVSSVMKSVTMVELAAPELTPVAVSGLSTPILIRMTEDTAIPADHVCAFLDANDQWSQNGVRRATDTEIAAASGATAGAWCATSHLSTFALLIPATTTSTTTTSATTASNGTTTTNSADTVNATTTIIECELADMLDSNSDCFEPALAYPVLSLFVCCCCCCCCVCYLKRRRPIKGKLKLQDQKGDAHEFEFAVEKAMTQRGAQDRGGDPAKQKIFVKWDVDIEQAKQTDYEFVKSRSGVNVTGTGLVLKRTEGPDEGKIEVAHSPRSVRSKKLTEAEEEAEVAFVSNQKSLAEAEEFALEVTDEPDHPELPGRSVSGIGYEAYGDGAHIEYFSETHKKWLQGCIHGLGSVESGKQTPVYSVMLSGGASKQVRHFVETSSLRAPFRAYDPVSVRIGKSEEDWSPAVVKSRQSFPLGYEVDLLEPHAAIKGTHTTVPPDRVRPRFPDGAAVEVYRGVKLGWFPGVVKAADTQEGWQVVLVEMASDLESDSKEAVRCQTCHVRMNHKPPPVQETPPHKLTTM